ncbi:MAG TPA: alkaline phosphatase family protein [Steroidobacteraceae bacterium]|jgi:hypothetical protein|nr:alkaline phosphatase family protein [Steroidobacteraceae bacterium]
MSRTTVFLLAMLFGEAAHSAAAPAPALPAIRHVFVLVLENQSYADTFASGSPAPYLSHTLVSQGALLTQYYAVGHASLDNYLALVSGQAPNDQTQLDCPVFSDFSLSMPSLDRNGQALGSGCVYPPLVRTLPDQLEAARFTWKAYMEDMGNDPRREPATCGHVPVGASDPTALATATDQYAAKHNPFVYFHSIIDDQARCDSHVVNLTRLPADLASAASTPNYVFITPNLCNDGHDPKCADGRRGGFVAIEPFLNHWVPLILGSAAFRADGLLIVTFDESDGAGEEGSAACCAEQPLPGARYAPGFNGPGGGRIGAVLLSPFIAPGTVSAVPYNHYSLLRTIEAIFGLPPLGYAAQPDLKVLGRDVWRSGAPSAHAR